MGDEGTIIGDRVIIRVDPENSLFAEGSPDWQREREELVLEMTRRLGPGLVEDGKAEPGDKGIVLVPIILALGSAGVFTAVTKCFEAWLQNRPGERRLKVRAIVDGKEISLDVTAENVRADGLQPLLRALPVALK